MNDFSITNVAKLPPRATLPMLLAAAEKKTNPVGLWRNIARLSADLNNWDQARHYITLLLGLDNLDEASRLEVAQLYLRMGQAREALAALGAIAPDSPRVLYTRGLLWSSLGELEAVREIEERLAAEDAGSGRGALLRIERLNREGDFAGLAAACSGYLENHRPDARVRWLLMKARGGEDVAPLVISYPPGDGVELQASVAGWLEAQDGWVADPREYATTGGEDLTQVINDQSLSNGGVAGLCRLQRESVLDYLAQMRARGVDWFRPKPSTLERSSWAVRLNRSGYHLSHFHPSGWISGVYYVEAGGSGGDIEFGYSGQDGEFVPVHRVSPRPGELLLFPSFIEHRTTPYEGDGQRVAIAFDLSL